MNRSLKSIPSMHSFARTIFGYHGFRPESADFGRRLLAGEVEVREWRPSQNDYDWLGHGLYFWEYGPERAREWALPDGFVIGAIIQLGRCLDLMDIGFTRKLAEQFDREQQTYAEKGLALPANEGLADKLRKLDCLVINSLASTVGESGSELFQTVRCAFEEGDPAFPGSKLKSQTHIQVAVRDQNCILGFFRPSFEVENVL